MGTHRELTPPPYFEWSDAWVFAAISGSVSEDSSVDFRRLIECGDVLNHAILMVNEIRAALVKFAKRGLIEFDDRVARVTPLAAALNDRIAKKPVGLFSVVDNTLAVLNSSRTKLPILEIEPDISFVSEKFVHGEGRR